MAQTLGYIALVVRDYDEAIAFFTTKLEFQLIEDTNLGNGKRWVRVRPQGSTGTDLPLARAANPEQDSRIGNQTVAVSFYSCTLTTSGATIASSRLAA